MVGKSENGRGDGCRRRLPEWLKRPLPAGEQCEQVVKVLEQFRLETVCGSAACPNRGECFSLGTATFMIMGDSCTRDCQFCAVRHEAPGPLEGDEPERLARATEALGLKYVVITSVTRDDLADGGAGHFARTIEAVREVCPETMIEVLTPDFLGETRCLDVVCGARPDVFNHNVETTRRLTPEIRSEADYERSLGVLRHVVGKAGGPTVKSGFMLGLGEQEREIVETLEALRGAGVEILTIGQYLRPGQGNRPVSRFYRPEEFDEYRKLAEGMGFSHVAAGPFVRSSYHAELSLTQATEDKVGEDARGRK